MPIIKSRGQGKCRNRMSTEVSSRLAPKQKRASISKQFRVSGRELKLWTG